nr:translation initiation factor IF-2 isoform X1 [Pongo abelii]
MSWTPRREGGPSSFLPASPFPLGPLPRRGLNWPRSWRPVAEVARWKISPLRGAAPELGPQLHPSHPSRLGLSGAAGEGAGGEGAATGCSSRSGRLGPAARTRPQGLTSQWAREGRSARPGEAGGGGEPRPGQPRPVSDPGAGTAPRPTLPCLIRQAARGWALAKGWPSGEPRAQVVPHSSPRRRKRLQAALRSPVPPAPSRDASPTLPRLPQLRPSPGPGSPAPGRTPLNPGTPPPASAPSRRQGHAHRQRRSEAAWSDCDQGAAARVTRAARRLLTRSHRWESARSAAPPSCLGLRDPAVKRPLAPSQCCRAPQEPGGVGPWWPCGRGRRPFSPVSAAPSPAAAVNSLRSAAPSAGIRRPAGSESNIECRRNGGLLQGIFK